MGTGLSRKRRKIGRLSVKRLNVEIMASNYERLESIADARQISLVTCVDEMVELIWDRWVRHHVPRETVPQKQNN